MRLQTNTKNYLSNMYGQGLNGAKKPKQKALRDSKTSKGDYSIDFQSTQQFEGQQSLNNSINQTAPFRSNAEQTYFGNGKGLTDVVQQQAKTAPQKNFVSINKKYANNKYVPLESAVCTALKLTSGKTAREQISPSFGTKAIRDIREEEQDQRFFKTQQE